MQGGQDSSRLQPPNWDKEVDQLYDAVRGQGTDEVCIVKILARFTNRQRKRLLQAYKERFHKVRKTFRIQTGNLKGRKAGSEKEESFFFSIFFSFDRILRLYWSRSLVERPKKWQPLCCIHQSHMTSSHYIRRLKARISTRLCLLLYQVEMTA